MLGDVSRTRCIPTPKGNPTSFPGLCEFGRAGDEKALVQAGHVTINIPNIWEYFVTWSTLIMCKLQNNKKFKRIKILDVHPVNGKYGDK